MALLEMGGKRFTLHKGKCRSVPIPAASSRPSGVLPRHAKLKSLPDGQVVITRRCRRPVLINGVRLGAITPLLHGDKVEVGGQGLPSWTNAAAAAQYVRP
jgi:hypothetical protein